MDSNHDLTLVFDGFRNKLKVFAYDGLRYEIKARNLTVNSPADELTFGHWGKAPPGDYGVGTPQKCSEDEIAFGPWFIPFDGKPATEYGRGGLGIHGGGSGLPDPMAAEQGWLITHGCIRLQNKDLERLAGSIRYAQKHEGIVTLRVVWQK